MCFLRFVPPANVFGTPTENPRNKWVSIPWSDRIHPQSNKTMQRHQKTQIQASSSFHFILPSPGASAQRSLAPSQDFSMCQNASLVLHLCSPGLTSSRLPPLSFDQSHFSCQGDPALVDAFVGLNPQQEKHQFQIDILPVIFFSVSKQHSILRKWGLGCELRSAPR